MTSTEVFCITLPLWLCSLLCEAQKFIATLSVSANYFPIFMDSCTYIVFCNIEVYLYWYIQLRYRLKIDLANDCYESLTLVNWFRSQSYPHINDGLWFPLTFFLFFQTTINLGCPPDDFFYCSAIANFPYTISVTDCSVSGRIILNYNKICYTMKDKIMQPYRNNSCHL